jgi:hypothetical protein
MKITICTLFALLSAMPSMINAQEQEPKVNFNVTLVSQWYDANYGYDSTGPPENHPANISIDGQGWKYVGELTFAELGPTNGRNFTVERQKTEWPGQLGKIVSFHNSMKLIIVHRDHRKRPRSRSRIGVHQDGSE